MRRRQKAVEKSSDLRSKPWSCGLEQVTSGQVGELLAKEDCPVPLFSNLLTMLVPSFTDLSYYP